MKRTRIHSLFLSGIGLLGLAATASAMSPVPVSLSGDTSYDEWTTSSLTAGSNSGYGSFPGTSAWPAPIGSNLGGDASLMKTANGSGGGPYPAGSSIYYGGFSSAVNTNGGTLAVTDSTIDFDLNTVVFQIEISEAWGYDFYNDVAPTLSYNGGSQALAATFTTLVYAQYNGTVSMPTGDEPVYINLYAYQWDLSGVSETITSYSISWTGVQHAQLYSLRLDSSSAIYGSAVVSAVPEPHEYALAISGLLLALVVVRRRQRRAEAC